MTWNNSAMITSSPKSSQNETKCISLLQMAEQVYNKGCGLLSDVGEYVASHRIGQFLFRKVDDLLWTLEKTTQWSVAPKLKSVAVTSVEASKSTLPDSSSCQSTGEFVRPLPWVFFIPLLISMRVARVWLGIGFRLIGKEPTTPKEVVRYIHNIRRRLRVIRFRGMRNLNRVKDDSSNIASLTSFLTSRDDDAHDNGSKSDLNMDIIGGPLSSGDDDAMAAFESIDQYMNRLAKKDENHLYDPDFRPNSSLETNTSNTTNTNTDGSLTSSSDDDDDNVRQPPSSKVRQRSRPISIISSEVIQEVSEDSSTLSISTSEEDYVEKSQRRVKRALDDLAPYLRLEKTYLPHAADDRGKKRVESALPFIIAVEEARKAQVAALPEEDRPASSENIVFTFEPVEASRSGSESTPLSTQSVDRGLVTSTASSAIDTSDHSHDSTLLKMSNLFSIKKKAPKPN